MLAARLATVVGRVIDLHCDLLRPFRLECRRDVELKSIVAALVAAHFLAIHRHPGLPIHRAEVQQHLASAPFLGHYEVPAVSHPVRVLHHSGQGGLDRVGHQDLGGVPGAQLEIPKAIEIEPILADHLRSWVFRQRIFGGNLLGPSRFQRTAGLLPIRRMSGSCQDGGENKGEPGSGGGQEIERSEILHR